MHLAAQISFYVFLDVSDSTVFALILIHGKSSSHAEDTVVREPEELGA